MVKTIAWILVLWVAISFIYSYKKGERMDWGPLKQLFENCYRDRPVITIIVIIAVIIVLYKILF